MLVGDIQYRWRGDTQDLEKSAGKADRVVSEQQRKSTLWMKAFKLSMAAGIATIGTTVAGVALKSEGAGKIVEKFGSKLGVSSKLTAGFTAGLASLGSGLVKVSSPLSAVTIGLGGLTLLLASAKAATIGFGLAFTAVGTVSMAIGTLALLKYIMGAKKYKVFMNELILTITAWGAKLRTFWATLSSAQSMKSFSTMIENFHFMREGIFAVFGPLSKFSTAVFTLGTVADATGKALTGMGLFQWGAKLTQFGAAAFGVLSILSYALHKAAAKAKDFGKAMMVSSMESAKAAGELQRNIWGLSVALEGYTKRIGYTSLELDDFARSIVMLSVKTGVSMSEMQQGVLTMLDMARVTGLNAHQISELTNRIADFASVTGQPFLTIVYAVDQAMRGYWRSLASLGIQMDETTMAAAGFTEGLSDTKQGLSSAESAATKFRFLMHETEFVANKASVAIRKNLPDAIKYYESSLSRLHAVMGAGMTTVWAKFYYYIGLAVNAFTNLLTPIAPLISLMRSTTGTILYATGAFISLAATLISVAAGVSALRILLFTGIQSWGIPAIANVLASLLKQATGITKFSQLVKVLFIGSLTMAWNAVKWFGEKILWLGGILLKIPRLLGPWGAAIAIVTAIVGAAIYIWRRHSTQLDRDFEAIQRHREGLKDEIEELKKYQNTVEATSTSDEERIKVLFDLSAKYAKFAIYLNKTKPVKFIQESDIKAQITVIDDAIEKIGSDIDSLTERLEDQKSVINEPINLKVSYPKDMVEIYSNSIKSLKARQESLNKEKQELIEKLKLLPSGFKEAAGAGEIFKETIKDLQEEVEVLNRSIMKYLEAKKLVAEKDVATAKTRLEASKSFETIIYRQNELTKYEEKHSEILKSGTDTQKAEYKRQHDILVRNLESALMAYDNFAKKLRDRYLKLKEIQKAIIAESGTYPGMPPIEIKWTAEEELERAEAAGKVTYARIKAARDEVSERIKLWDKMRTAEKPEIPFKPGTEERFEDEKEFIKGYKDQVNELEKLDRQLTEFYIEQMDIRISAEQSWIDFKSKAATMLGKSYDAELINLRRSADEFINTYVAATRKVGDSENDFKIKSEKLSKELRKYLFPLEWSVDEENKFQEWIEKMRKVTSMALDPENIKDEAYNYRKAFKAGIEPTFDEVSKTFHWPSEFKMPWHENRFVEENGKIMDTITGQAVSAAGKERLIKEANDKKLMTFILAWYSQFKKIRDNSVQEQMDELYTVYEAWTDYYDKLDMLRARGDLERGRLEIEQEARRDMIKNAQEVEKLEADAATKKEMIRNYDKWRENKKNEDLLKLEKDIELEREQTRIQLSNMLSDANTQEIEDARSKYLQDVNNYEELYVRGIITSEEQLKEAKKNRAKLLERELTQIRVDALKDRMQKELDYEKQMAELKVGYTKVGGERYIGEPELLQRARDIKARYDLLKVEAAQELVEKQKLYGNLLIFKEQYDAKIIALDEARQAAIADLLEKEPELWVDYAGKTMGVWDQMCTGMLAAFQNFMNQVPTIAQATFSLFNNFLGGITDAWTDVFTKLLVYGRVTKDELLQIWTSFVSTLARQFVNLGLQMFVGWIMKLILGKNIMDQTTKSAIANMAAEGVAVVTLTGLYMQLWFWKTMAGVGGAGGGVGGAGGGGGGTFSGVGPLTSFGNKQKGGKVEGQGKGDKYPFFLEAGEQIVDSENSKRLGDDFFSFLRAGKTPVMPMPFIQTAAQREGRGYRSYETDRAQSPQQQKITVVNVFDENEMHKFYGSERFGTVVVNRVSQRVTRKLGRR